MGPPAQGSPRGSGRGSSGEEDAKNMFDRIGEIVQGIVHTEALTYENELHGLLTNATYPNDENPKKSTPENPCQLDHIYHTNVTDGHNDPCGNRPDVRFSDVIGGQCTDHKIKGNNTKNGGACAPLRRIFLCDQNLEHIKEEKIENTHNLLLEVCLAAQYEGESIVKNYEQLGHHTTEGVCTALARSFADIGDIVRGKDLFLGHSKEKEKLEQNLQKIFEKLKSSNPQLTNVSLEKIREDWWALNRQEIWKAITCDAPDYAKYFGQTCGGGTTATITQCRCATNYVPTYFDYVPQYLRWFEEWAEEFCRKKKIYVGIVKTYCRGETEGEKYCSLNGHDCEQTIKAIGRFVMGNGCTKCLIACSRYKGWLANQKKEFEKQKEKYTNEINGSSSQKKGTSDIGNNEYDRKFYEKLKTEYEHVDKFLKLLNKENECKVITKEEGNINFPKNEREETFYGSKYCEPCPECGVDCEGNECKPRPEGHEKCKKQVPERTKEPNITEIDFLLNEEEGNDIVKKLKPFCDQEDNSNDKGIEKWKCSYYGEKDNDCEMQKKDKHPKHDTKIMEYIEFFELWVTHMLKDSIDWRNKLYKCLKNDKKQCVNNCNRNCKCYEKWIEKKEEEWGKIKDHYEKQELPKGGHYAILEGVLVEEFFNDITEAYDDPNETERIKKMLEKQNNQETDDTRKRKTIIDYLLDHEKDDAELCLQTHEDDEKCDEDEEDEDYHEEPPIVKSNPCPNGSSTRHPVLATKAAHQMHDQARQQLTSRAGGRKALKADAKKGKYMSSRNHVELKEICKITNDHSNATGESKNPCHGKDNDHQRFNVGTPWQGDSFVNRKYPEAYMPPRREHMCTSNLENLDVGSVTRNGDASHSLLVDVMLAAKTDASEIIKRYKDQNNISENIEQKDEEAMCRAIRYSFADLGDIIRGRDLWDKDGGSSEMEKRLIDIFKNIKSNLPIDIQKEYVDSKKFLDLRRDWWEANRHQVWRAMQCALNDLKKFDGDCAYSRGTHTPYDDYIPQRLRWMTEWAEWYCKAQSQEYKKLEEKCSQCRTDGIKKCTNKTSECDKCTQACAQYKTKIETWRKQWQQMEMKYTPLYHQAKIDARNVRPSVYGGPKDQYVIDFFKKLQKEINRSASQRSKRSTRATTTDTLTPTTPYSTAEGYVHQEATMNCDTQTQFCEKKHGGTTPTGTENKEYVFKDKPHDHDTPCNCDKPPKKDACKIVEEIYRTSKGGKNGINSCYRKNYNGWTCDPGQFENGHTGACMPPRRKSLCIYILTLQEQIKDEDKLREAFIKCAAAETCLLWHKYKDDKEKEETSPGTSPNPDSELKNGTIPEEFKRQMFYTFGDYRDICLDTDISSKRNTRTGVGKVKDNIHTIFKDSGKTPNEKREKFWKDHKESIWKGMLCALEKIANKKDKLTGPTSIYTYSTVTFSGDKSPTLEKFAQTPQFLRWFIEWSDDFCIQQKKELKTLENKCNFSTCDDANDNEKKKCHQACWNYKAFLEKWKKQYKKQNIEFEGLTYTDSIIKDKSAPEYLEENCKDKCSCIKEADYTHYNKSFQYPPEMFQEKCLCELSYPNEMQYSKKKKSEPEQKKEDPYKNLGKCPFENRSNSRDSTTTVINNDNCKNLNVQSLCIQNKYENNLDQWTGKLVRDSSKDNEGVLMPPRRVHLCSRTITKNKYRTNETDKFKKDLFDSAYNQGYLLGKKFKDYNDEGHEALKNSFADYGDIIKGEDIMETTTPTDIKEKLEKLLKNAEKTAQSNGTTPQPKSVNQWWEQYRTSVWHAMLCGYHQGINGPQTLGRRRGRQSQPVTALTSSPTTKTIPPNWCQLPTDDSTDQFLRWLREWGTQYCKEKQQLKSNMQMPCKSHLDKYGIIEKKNDINPNCLPSLEKYEVWSNKRLPEWDGLSKKFTKDIAANKYNNSNVEETSAENYLKQNCSECKCSFKDIEQTHEKSIKGGHDIFVDILDKAQIPGFVEDIAYRYKGINPKCPEDNECDQYRNIRCKLLPHDDNRDWESTFVKNNKTTNKNVLVPPRRRHICLRVEPNKLRQLKKREENFKKFICSSAFAEAKRLKKVYKDDNDKLLQAMKYSFSDIGSIVKGNDMMESPTSRYIEELFNSAQYTGTNRKNWWNENKYHVWESMLCGYKEAQGDTKKSENCRFPDIERVPQFLRWFQEWTEIFCTKRNELYKKIDTNCTSATCNKEDGSVAKTECTKACEEYKNYVLKKKKEYEIQKHKYDKEFKSILNNKDAPEFLKVPCLSKIFNENKEWKNPYDTFDDDKHKDKCDCKKIEPSAPVVPDSRPPSPPPKTDELPIAADEPFDPTILQTTIPFGIALALGSIAYIPYRSGSYKGKTYIYMEGDSSGDEKYAFMSDTTDVTSSESEYEELDINDIYVPGSPKYKTLIEVVLEPSGNNTTASGKNTPSDTQNDIHNDIPSSDIPTNKFTDEEWNQLKKDFISNMLQNTQNTEPNILHDNVDNNTHPTPSRNKLDQKPFIMSIHDRNLYTGEEYNYDMINNIGNNDLYSGIDSTSGNAGPYSDKNGPYSGIDLINDSLNSGNHDIYNELLKRKENELFGTNHVKQTSIHSVAKLTNSDPILNQINLFHTWLDRHRDMCEQWNNKEELLDKLKEEWNKDNNNSGNINPSGNTPPTSDIPSGKQVLNTDVSIQIHMDDPKPINQFTNMDTILEDLEKYNEPYYDVQDDIYYDLHDHDTPTVDTNAMDVPSKVQIEMDVNTKLVKEKYPIADVWDI
ncbi:hypothetical protein PFNF135_00160 [Plasmodium falciparum NF135/5.C10]|uniref:Erythrocyte membrane protein 1 n=1 Tax=Plasmodium falciparum NF135/5.C10 TaxID=1036726 RepID=W4INF1_PLAFA|nr:hypothetical protein PFNF135_00160 [Plasmodium falciparum NF135/5.C10]